MNIQLLTIENLHLLVELEQTARISEPDIFVSDFNSATFEAETAKALNNPTFHPNAKCMMYIDENGKAVGRIDFTVVPSFSFGGNLQVYVDWVYVLKEFRHKGIAQLLFAAMEEYIKGIGIGDYFLIMAENSEADKFYRSIPKVEISNCNMLRKYV